MSASGEGIAVGQQQGDIYAPRFYGDREVSWPVVVGVIPPEPEHYQRRPVDDQLTQVVQDNSAVVLGQVVSGMGGVGKTQIAIHHTISLLEADEVDLVVWVQATDRASIIQTYAQAAHTVIPGRVSESPEQAAHQFRAWLQNTSKRWLVVLDNLDDPDQTQGLWPPTTARGPTPNQPETKRRWELFRQTTKKPPKAPSPQGRVVVTTRRADLIPPGRDRVVLPVGLYTPEEALDYLASALRSLVVPPVEEGLRDLAEELGYLPLALSHAAAYLADPTSHTGCSDYLQRFRARKDALHRLLPQQNLPEDYPWTVATTWAISIEHANALAPQGLAQPLMRLIGLLDPSGIPMILFATPTVRDYLALNRPEGDVPSVGDIMDTFRVLERLHLVGAVPSKEEGPLSAGLVTVHRVLQRATRDHPHTCPDQVAITTAADAIAQMWPNYVHATLYGQFLRSNTAALADHAGLRLWEPESHPVLFHAGTSLGESGSVKEACDYWNDLLAKSIRLLGHSHLHTLSTRSHLALWQAEAGNLAKARIEFEALLQDRSRVLGSDHPHTLATRDKIATCRMIAGDSSGAKDELESLLPDLIRVLGHDDPHTLNARSKIASCWADMGDAARAASEFETLLQDQARALGPDHPHTLATRNNFGACQARTGDIEVSKIELETLLHDLIHKLGPDHPYTLNARNNLAHRRADIGDVSTAVAELEALCEDQFRIFGPDHPGTFTARNNLASMRAQLGDSLRATAELESLLQDEARHLSPDHPITLTTRKNLASCRIRTRDFAKAEGELTSLAPDLIRIFGHQDPRTQETIQLVKLFQRKKINDDNK